MFADRPHRLRDHGRPSSGRGGNLSAKEAQGGRRATGMRDHRREYHTLDRLAAAATVLTEQHQKHVRELEAALAARQREALLEMNGKGF